MSNSVQGATERALIKTDIAPYSGSAQISKQLLKFNRDIEEFIC